MTIDFSRKSRIKLYVCLGLTFLIFLFSLIMFLKDGKKRFVYTFPSADVDTYVSESRYFSRYNKDLTDLSRTEYYINTYINEILLGSTLERTKLLFNRGTKVNSCFLRDDVLYLDLSKDMLQSDADCIDIREGVNLLYENVYNNFKNLKKIELFVDGIYAYEEPQVIQADL